MSVFLNALQVRSCRLVTPWSGVPFADLDLALDDVGVMPSGKAVLAIGESAPPFVVTVDPRRSGTFAKEGRARVLVGGGGWDMRVPAQHFHGAVTSTVVFSATAAAVGEAVIDVVPKPFGLDFVRIAGRASRVLDGVDWYVRPDGVTVVGPRPLIPLDLTSATIVAYDPLNGVVEVASNDPIVPGTLLVDPTRFDGVLTVRDVEQVWDESGARATCWCGEATGSRLQDALYALIAERSRIAYLRKYIYRVVAENPADETLVLQSVDPLSGAPDAIPLAMWPGMSGVSAQLTPGSLVLVEFVNADPSKPVVTSFEKGVPVILELDASTIVKVGQGAKGPVAMATGTQAQIAALQSEIATLAASVTAIGLALATLQPTATVFSDSPPGTASAAASTACGGAAGAVTAGASTVTAGVTPATSSKIVSD
jgi:hypothetical protein